MPTNHTSPYLPFGDQRTAPWYGKDIISVKQFGRGDLEYVFGVAHEMRGMVERVGTFDLLKGKILANLFYEPSTRTSSSFTAAMERLGGSVIPINEVKYSSVSKGESLPDTIRTLECYADVIVLRHPETARRFAHARPSGHDDQIRRLQPRRQVVQVREPRRHPRHRLLLLVETLDRLDRPDQDLGDPGERLLHLALLDAEDELLGAVEAVLGFQEELSRRGGAVLVEAVAMDRPGHFVSHGVVEVQ